MTLHKILETRKRLLVNNELPTEQDLKDGYRLFKEKFGPEKLKELNGMDLLEVVFSHGNRSSLVYWLEFKNDEEFQTVTYGSIAGGSAYKFIIFKRSSDGTWMTGSGQNPVELSLDEAIKLAEQIRDNLVLGAELISNISNMDEPSYIKLQNELTEKLEMKMSSLGWVHKYYHMILPDKIDDFHNMDWQKNAIIKLKQKPVSPGGLYSYSGQLILLANEINIPINHFTHCINKAYGAPNNYIRVGTTSDAKSFWQEMYSEGYVSIGWPVLGDLRRFEDLKITEMKNEIKVILTDNYTTTPQTIGRWTSQIAAFITRLKKGAIVVASEGQTVLGIGKIIGSYQFLEGKDFPHTIKTEWLKTPNRKLPNPTEGLQTTIYSLKDIDNLLEIEKILSEEGGIEMIATPTKLENLTGVAAKIEGIINRKKQVILYGPPGTGKTFHAEKTCHELAARQLYKKNFADLTKEEALSMSERGIVRICTFHPTYGYEDFIEGIKPKIVNESTLFELKDGIFKSICSDAKNNPTDNYYLIIDEINRGDISRIFGELITIIESNKRGKEVLLPLSNELFCVPPNVFIIGTMNTADRSIALLDVALRRRFGFIELLPDYKLLEGVSIENLPLSEWLKALNHRIVKFLGQDARNLQIGHSYFLEKENPVTNYEKFMRIIEEDIVPLIEEYCYGDYPTISKILGAGIIDVKTKTIKEEIFNEGSITPLVNALLVPTPELSTAIIELEDEDSEEEVIEDQMESMAD